MLELLEDIQELRPTIFSSVPRLWNRIYDKVMAQASGVSEVSHSGVKPGQPCVGWGDRERIHGERCMAQVSTGCGC